MDHLDYRILSESEGPEVHHDMQLCAYIIMTKTRLLLRTRECFQILEGSAS